jgi:hypothetical protein
MPACGCPCAHDLGWLLGCIPGHGPGNWTACASQTACALETPTVQQRHPRDRRADALHEAARTRRRLWPCIPSPSTCSRRHAGAGRACCPNAIARWRRWPLKLTRTPVRPACLQRGAPSPPAWQGHAESAAAVARSTADLWQQHLRQLRRMTISIAQPRPHGARRPGSGRVVMSLRGMRRRSLRHPALHAHLSADRLPPARAFWSLSAYELTPGGRAASRQSIDRYSLGDRTPDWSAPTGLTLYIQREPPPSRPPTGSRCTRRCGWSCVPSAG